MRFRVKFLLKLFLIVFLVWSVSIFFWLTQDGCSDSDYFKFFCKTHSKKDSENKFLFKQDNKLNDQPGEMGRPVTFPPEMKEEVQKSFEINQFNLMASDKISVNRSLPDFRSPECVKKAYPVHSLPSTSVIITFHNEAWSTLTRTLWSVINRTPTFLLEEIIFVDDASEKDFLKEPLDKYITSIDVRIQIIRMPVRSGLVKARLKGASAAQGEVLTFLDSHCECMDGWLEPLLFEIYKNNKTISSPIIDIIRDDNFHVVKGASFLWGAFSWTLTFKWYAISDRENERRKGDKTEPIRTPTIAGGLFSIKRQYFYDIGTYDEGMDVWGAENLEISFRTWMCGGQLLIIPCSHVGHVFRKKTPYVFPGGSDKVILRNNARLVEVWLDEWKDFYYALKPVANALIPGDLTARFQLRKKLQCKSFKWYLTNIFPESQYPLNYLFLGNIKNMKTNSCMVVDGKKNNESLFMAPCYSQIIARQLFLGKLNQTIQNEHHCLTSNGLGKTVTLSNCHDQSSNKKWIYDPKEHTIQTASKPYCLTIDQNLIKTTDCTKDDPNKYWHVKTFEWKSQSS